MRRVNAAAWLMVGLAAIGAHGGEPERADRVGQRVVAPAGGLTLRDDRGAVAGVGEKGQVYRVERADGRRLWLRAEGKDLGGWATADEVVAVAPPVDRAVRRAEAIPRRTLGSALAAPFRRRIEGRPRARRRRAHEAGLRPGGRRVRRGDPARSCSAEAYLLRGFIRMTTNRPDEALADLDEAIRLDPRRAAGYGNRGVVRLMKNQPEDALADFNEAIRIDPRDVDAQRQSRDAVDHEEAMGRGPVRLRRGRSPGPAARHGPRQPRGDLDGERRL